MAWSAPPTFADTNVLSATQLNVLSDDLAFLYGILQAPQATFPSHFFNQDLSITNNGWAFRYRHRYFHYRVRVTSNTIDSLHLFVNGTDYTIPGAPKSAGEYFTGYIDVNAQGLTVGSVYEFYFTTTGDSGIIEYVIQAEGTTL